MPEGGYSITATLTLAAAAADVGRWLVEPELMDRWMLGLDGIEVLDDGAPAVGARIRVTTSSGRHAGWTFVGEITALDAGRVIRRYALTELRAEGLPLDADTSGYARTVTYLLAPEGADPATRLTCTAVTVIPGLDAAAGRTAAKAEQQTLERSLERLQAEVAGRQRGLLGRFRDSGQAPAPL